jgi:hypothetical protein
MNRREKKMHWNNLNVQEEKKTLWDVWLSYISREREQKITMCTKN